MTLGAYPPGFGRVNDGAVIALADFGPEVYKLAKVGFALGAFTSEALHGSWWSCQVPRIARDGGP